MYRPVLVTPPEVTPVSLAEAKVHCRADDFDDDNDTLEALVSAATAHFDGWTGTLGRVLCEQEWRQDFDSFARCMRLPLFPVVSVTSVTYRTDSGQLGTVGSTNYALQTDDLGSYVRFKDAYSFPSSLYQTAAISITFVAGYPDTPEVEAAPEADPPVEAAARASNVPAPIKQAILLLVGHWYDHREAVSSDTKAPVPFAVDALVAPFRRSRF